MFAIAALFAAVQRRKCKPRLCLSQLSVISEFISESAVKRQPQKNSKQQILKETLKKQKTADPEINSGRCSASVLYDRHNGNNKSKPPSAFRRLPFINKG
jgi:hypothetical protein